VVYPRAKCNDLLIWILVVVGLGFLCACHQEWTLVADGVSLKQACRSLTDMLFVDTELIVHTDCKEQILIIEEHLNRSLPLWLCGVSLQKNISTACVTFVNTLTPQHIADVVTGQLTTFKEAPVDSTWGDMIWEVVQRSMLTDISGLVSVAAINSALFVSLLADRFRNQLIILGEQMLMYKLLKILLFFTKKSKSRRKARLPVLLGFIIASVFLSKSCYLLRDHASTYTRGGLYNLRFYSDYPVYVRDLYLTGMVVLINEYLFSFFGIVTTVVVRNVVFKSLRYNLHRFFFLCAWVSHDVTIIAMCVLCRHNTVKPVHFDGMLLITEILTMIGMAYAAKHYLRM